jgi:hypothetical protein
MDELDELEAARARVNNQYNYVQECKFVTKDADRARHKVAFGSPERADADRAYQEAMRDHSDAVSYFDFLKKHYDDVRMHTTAKK